MKAAPFMVHSKFNDMRGLSQSASSSAAVERFDTIVDDLYYYRLGVIERLDALLREHPDLVLGHVLRGYSLMGEGTLDAQIDAALYLQRAEALPANQRERLHREALGAWIAQDLPARAAAWEQILVEWPSDLLAFRQYTGTLFWSGDKQHQAEVTAGIAPHWTESMPGYGHFLSAHAFAMEEVGQYRVAEQHARKALEIQPQDLWALHALAHVFEMQDRSGEGIDVLGEAATFLDDYNLFRGHLWWHLALFRLSQSEFDAALDLFDKDIYPRSSTFFLDIQNGASLLARLEFQGIDVGLARWERLAEAATASARQCTVWFTSMHHVMALARTSRTSAVAETLNYLDLQGKSSEQARLAHDLSQAAAAFYQNRPADALKQMLVLRQHQGGLGASHAQQDLYYQIMVGAALQLGDLARVRQLLIARLSKHIWDEPSWSTFMSRARQVAQINDSAAVSAALRISRDF